MQNIPNALLWIGAPQPLAQQVNQFLRAQFCVNLNHNNSDHTNSITSNLNPIINNNNNSNSSLTNINLANLNCTCNPCQQLNQKQHPQVLFIQPEQSYTVDTIKPILAQIAYQLDSHQKFFFVLPQVDQLSAVCANLLLKSIEEPPTGYHFILLAQRYYQVLPTIRSRSTISYFGANFINRPILTTENYFKNPQPNNLSTSTNSSSPANTPNPANIPAQELYLILTRQKAGSQDQFLQLITKLSLSDLEQIELLDQIILYWSQCYQQQLYLQHNIARTPSQTNHQNIPAIQLASKHPGPALESHNLNLSQLTQIFDLLNQESLKPPVRGSAKAFWRNLFIQLNQIIQPN